MYHSRLPPPPPLKISNPNRPGTRTENIYRNTSVFFNDDVKRRVPVGASHRAGDRRDQSDRTIEKKDPPPSSPGAAAAIIPG